MRFVQHLSVSTALFLFLAGCATGSDSERSDQRGPYGEIGHASLPTKDARNLGVPWEKDFGASAAIKTGDTIYVAAQMSYDETGKIVGVGDLEAQMRQAYANVKKVLGYYGIGMDRVVEEVIFVTDMKTALAAAARVRADAYAGSPMVASTILQVAQLPVPNTLGEIKVTAKAPPTSVEKGSDKSSSQRSKGSGGGMGRRGGMGYPF